MGTSCCNCQGNENNYIPYVGKFWSGKKLANLANCGLFANILPANNFFSEIQNYFSN